MENLKIKVNSAEESEEAQELFEALGYDKGLASHGNYPATIIANLKHDTAYSSRAVTNNHENHADYRLVTIPQLKDMVVLHQNDVSDANMFDPVFPNSKLFLTQDNKIYVFNKEKWELSPLSGKSSVLRRLNLITKEPVMQKEYLQKLADGTYKLIVLDSVVDGHEGLIEVPEGALVFVSHGAKETHLTFYGNKNENGQYECYPLDGFDANTWRWSYYRDESFNDSICKRYGRRVLWRRHTQPEELPFVDNGPLTEDDFNKAFGETKSVNDQYAEIEQVRQQSIKLDDDNVNHPSHYASGTIECIDAIESSMTKEAFAGYLKGNVQKYMWRYENKGGVESLQKAQWYLNKLISNLESK